MDFDDLMKKTKQVEEKLMAMRDELSQTVVTGKAGGGLVEIDIFVAGHDIKAVRIADNLMKPEQKNMLQDLIAASMNHAIRKAEEVMKSKIGSLASNMPFDMNNMFKKDDSGDQNSGAE